VKPVPGLHRVPGDTVVVSQCAGRYDKRDPVPLRGVRDAKAVASVLKLYLDALPEPLMKAGVQVSQVTKNVASAQSKGQKVELLSEFVATHVSTSSNACLCAVTAHLKRVAEADAGDASVTTLREVSNNRSLKICQKSIKALAKSFVKTLLGESTGGQDREHRVHVVELLITHGDEVFGKSIHGTGSSRRFTKPDEKENGADTSSVALGEPGKKSPARDRTGDGQVTTDDAKPTVEAEADRLSPDFSLDFALRWCFDCFANHADHLAAEVDRVAGGNLISIYASRSVESFGDDWEALQNEKGSIKRRLRAFDACVVAGNNSSNKQEPTKEDKKHLRPLYLRLAKVKRQMRVAETSR